MDPDLVRAAIAANGEDVQLCVGFLDYFDPETTGATEPTEQIRNLAAWWEDYLGAPIAYFGTGPNSYIWMNNK